MNAERYEEIITRGAAVNLSTRAKWRLSGADRVRYLNGQVTNDVRTVSPAKTLYACVTDVKGRACGDVFIHATADALLLDADADLRETLGARLERYIVSDDAELTDVTEEWQLWHVFGPDLPAGVACERFGMPGVDFWIPSGETFSSAKIELTAEEAETLRILQKVPRWGHELTNETFPPEAGLEEKAMSFTKGCYIGQEVLSRIKTTGKMPRVMQSFESETAVSVGDDFEGGKVTSVTRHPVTGKCVGLLMKRFRA
jgi:folate-binding protein YgfZ